MGSVIRRAKSRFWYVKFVDQFGRQKMLVTRHPLDDPGGKTKATKYLAGLESAVDRGELVSDRSKTFHDLIDAYLSKPNLRELTRQEYAQVIDARLEPFFGRIRLIAVRRERVEQYRDHARTIKSVRGTPLSPRTLNRDLVLLSAMFEFARKRQWVIHNPAEGVDRLRVLQRDVRILNPDEIRRLLANAGSARNRVLFRTAVETGMRQGELLALRWDDVDLVNGWLKVRRSFRKGYEDEPKSERSNRMIGLTPQLLSELGEWRLECPSPSDPSKPQLVFPNGAGHYELHGNLLHRDFWPALRRAGLPRIRFHDLRHTLVSLLLESGTPILRVQAIAGHADAKTTMGIYGHLLPGAMKELAATISLVMDTISDQTVSH